MSVTTGTFPGVRIADMPDLGAVNDASSFVGERAGSGRFSALSMRTYFTHPSTTIPITPSIDYTPVGGSGVPTYGGWCIEGTTGSSDHREFLASFTLNSATGHGASGATGDKVAIYGAVNAMIGSGPAWAMNLTATIQAGAALAASPNPSLTNTELDIANFSAAVGSTPGPAGLVPPCAWGLMVGSSGTFATTAAIIVAANSTTTNFYRGVCVNTAMSAAFSDYSLASWGLEMSGTHTIGLNLEGMGGSTAMSIANGAAIVARNSAGTGGIGLIASTGNAVTIGNSATFVYMGDDTCPLVANAYNLGDAAARWAAVWAVNGTIQTSDPALKTDIAPLPSVLPLLAAINPVTFKWKDGGSETVEATEVQTVQERELLEWDEDRVEVVDGRAVLSTVHRSYLSEAFDEVPVFDAAGQPVHLKPPTREDKAARWREQTGGRPVVRTHRVPRMVTKEVAVKRQVSHAGRRTHWGFMAPEIKAAFDAMGMDFGGYVRGDDGTHNLRPDQLIAVLWKVCQELKAEIDAMKGATPA